MRVINIHGQYFSLSLVVVEDQRFNLLLIYLAMRIGKPLLTHLLKIKVKWTALLISRDYDWIATKKIKTETQPLITVVLALSLLIAIFLH